MKSMKKIFCALLVAAVLAFCVPMLAQAVSEDTPKELKCGESDTITLAPLESVEYQFTAPSSGSYVFWTPDGEGYWGYDGWWCHDTLIFEGSAGELIPDDTHEVWFCQLSAGETVILTVGAAEFASRPTTGTIHVDKTNPPKNVHIEGMKEIFYEKGVVHRLQCVPETGPTYLMGPIHWSSSDTSVISIDNSWGNNVYLSSNGVGNAVLTAELENGVKASYAVTVKKPEEWECGESKVVVLEPDTYVSYAFTPETSGSYALWTLRENYVTDENGNTYNNSLRVEFPLFFGEAGDSTYDASLCYMEAGKTYNLRVLNDLYDDPHQRTATVYFDRVTPPEKIELKSYESVYCVGQPAFEVFCYPETGPNFMMGDVKWFSSDESVARPPADIHTSNSFASFEPVGPGKAVITAELENGVTASYEITVKLPERQLSCGESDTITLEPGDATYYEFIPETSGNYVFWTYYEEYEVDAMGSVHTNGMYLSASSGQGCFAEGYQWVSLILKAGEPCTLKVQNGGHRGTETVYLDKLETPESIRILPIVDYCFDGDPEDRYYIVNCIAENGLPFIADGIDWSSSDDSVLSFDYIYGQYGFFAVNGVGTAVIKAELHNGAVATYEVTVEEYVFKDYEVVAGQDAIVEVGGVDPLEVRIDADIGRCLDVVCVDGISVDPKYVEITEGSTIVTLSAEYLNTLDPGKHVMTVEFVDGLATVPFEIQESKTLPGDVNGDGEVNGRDMIRLKKYLANYDDETGVSTVEIFGGADCNGDDQVNGRDLIRLKKYLANYDDETGSSTVVLGP